MSNRTQQIIEDTLTYYTTLATGTGAISTTITAPLSDKSFALKEVRISLSDYGGAGILTIMIDNGVNAVYDHVLLSQDMTSVKYLRYVPDGFPVPLKVNDKIVISYSNSNGRTYGVEALTVPHY